MRYWNLGDERLIRVLRNEIDGTMANFEVGPDGGVAVYVGARLLGVWVEFVRSRHSFVPAARLQPTRLHLPPEQVVAATLELVAGAQPVAASAIARR